HFRHRLKTGRDQTAARRRQVKKARCEHDGCDHKGRNIRERKVHTAYVDGNPPGNLELMDRIVRHLNLVCLPCPKAIWPARRQFNLPEGVSVLGLTAHLFTYT